MSAGLASWSGGESEERKLIVRGQANLLDDLHALEDLERVRLLFDDLEEKRGVADLLGRAEHAEGMRIFIGSENKLFSLSGSSTIVVALSRRAGPHRRRARRDRPDPAQLRAHHSDGRLHRQGGQQGAGRIKPASQTYHHEGLIFARPSPDIPGEIDNFATELTMTDPTAPRRRTWRARSAGDVRSRRRRCDPVAVLAREAADMKDRLLRTLAEMENLRRRTEKEVADARVYGVTNFARDILAVADNMERALKALDDEIRAKADAGVKALLDGVELTERELIKVMEKHGVRRLEPQGRSSIRTCIRPCSKCPTRRCPPARSCR